MMKQGLISIPWLTFVGLVTNPLTSLAGGGEACSREDEEACFEERSIRSGFWGGNDFGVGLLQPSSDEIEEKVAKKVLPSVHSLMINLVNFGDKRAGQIDGKLIGYRQAAFDVQMGALYSDLPVTEIIRQAVKPELTRRADLSLKTAFQVL